ncbi:nitroreductase family protein [Chloroflexota bacterium]
MDVWEAIENRRSARAFIGAVPEELLRRIVRAGSKAPSGHNSQPWEFIIVNDPEIIDQIAEQKYLLSSKGRPTDEIAVHQRNAYRNSSVVAICHKRGGFSHAAAWMAALNMALAAFSEGLASVMSTHQAEAKEAVEKILGLPDEYELATVLVIGVPESNPKEKEERPDFSWLHINRFGSSAIP